MVAVGASSRIWDGEKVIYSQIWLHGMAVGDPRLCRASHIPGSDVARSRGAVLERF